ncbi:DUF192 domain-containing protein [Patescibacteria group bacterium AH-259-L07]|nr:DUF192 domain-containing protein [Patescibacteria group bacterium AH-259-L07]
MKLSFGRKRKVTLSLNPTSVMGFLPKEFVFIIIIAILVVWGWLLYSQNVQKNVQSPALNKFSRVKINNVLINVELAQTLKEKTRGLSGRDTLYENQGMLFIYDTQDLYSFWMKDMKFPLDIIWIDKKYQIIDLHTNVLPESYPQTFQPKNPVQYVLEVNTGFCEKHNITVGDTVSMLF